MYGIIFGIRFHRFILFYGQNLKYSEIDHQTNVMLLYIKSQNTNEWFFGALLSKPTLVILNCN